MKFVLSSTYRYWWPVTVQVPDPSKPGELITYKLRVEIQPEDRDAAIKRVEEIAALPASEQTARELDQLKAVIKNWDDVLDVDGTTPVPFTAEAFDKALQWPWFRTALYRAYGESLNGEKPRLGN